MKIEIYKSKEKLTKSICNQMSQSSIQSFVDGNVLGYLVNVIKNSTKSFVLKNKGKYLTFPCNFRKSETCIFRKIGKWSSQIKIDDKDLMEKFWDKYQSDLENSVQIYI